LTTQSPVSTIATLAVTGERCGTHVEGIYSAAPTTNASVTSIALLGSHSQFAAGTKSMAVLRILHSAQTMEDNTTRSTAARFNGSIFPFQEVPKPRGKILPPSPLTIHSPILSIATSGYPFPGHGTALSDDSAVPSLKHQRLYEQATLGLR
jgi:hypothetical protein